MVHCTVTSKSVHIVTLATVTWLNQTNSTITSGSHKIISKSSSPFLNLLFLIWSKKREKHKKTTWQSSAAAWQQTSHPYDCVYVLGWIEDCPGVIVILTVTMMQLFWPHAVLNHIWGQTDMFSFPVSRRNKCVLMPVWLLYVAMHHTASEIPNFCSQNNYFTSGMGGSQ